MKACKIPYCKDIPNDWQEIPNRYLFAYHSVKVGEHWKDYQLLSLTTSGIKEKDINASGGKIPDSYDKYQTVEPGDMVFCLFDLDVSAVFSGLSNHYGMITSAYDVVKPNRNILNQGFSDYWFQYVFSNRYYKMYSKNIRFTITSEMFKAIKTPVPPLVIQKKIACFLNEKTAKIDKLIEIENKQIEKLKEYKQAVITEAVTKGLDKSAPMKDSGVEWIGKIPEEWGVKKIKFAYQSRIEKYISGVFPYIALENIESMSGKYVFTDSNTNYSLDGSIFAKKGDVIFGKLRPYLAKTLLVNDDSYVSAEFMVLHDNNNLPAFLKYLFLSICFIDVVNSSTCGTKMPRANAEFIQNLYIALPNLSKQRQIVSFLDKKCKKIDFLTEIKQKKIDMLNEYKKSLIYEYVTGKKEVI